MQSKSLKPLYGRIPTFTNAYLNFKSACRLLKAGMTSADIAQAFPEVYRSSDGLLGMKYDFFYVDQPDLYDTSRLVLKSAVTKAIREFKANKQEGKAYKR